MLANLPGNVSSRNVSKTCCTVGELGALESSWLQPVLFALRSVCNGKREITTGQFISVIQIVYYSIWSIISASISS